MNDDSLSRRRFLKAVGATSAVVLGAGALGCIGGKTNGDARPTTGLTYTVAGTVSSKFADFVPVAVDVKPSLGDYPMPASLTNVPGAAVVDDAGRAALAKNLFYLRPSKDAQIYDVYKDAMHAGAPAIVTTDAALHSYHILFDYALRILEVNKLSEAIVELTDLMLEASLAQLDAGIPELNDLCKKNVAFFAVAKSLLGGSVGSLPADVRQLVSAELALIDAHEGFGDSPIFGRHGGLQPVRAPGPLHPQRPAQKVLQGHDVVRAHVLQPVQVLGGRRQSAGQGQHSPGHHDHAGSAGPMPSTCGSPSTTRRSSSWARRTTCRSTTIQPLIKEVYGGTVGLPDLKDDEQSPGVHRKSRRSKGAEDRLRLPGHRRGQGRSSKASASWASASSRTRTCSRSWCSTRSGRMDKPRLFPMGLDVMAVLGSKRAYAVLDSLGETQYENYVKQFEALKASFAALKAEDWTQNLYWGWLYALLALLNEKGSGYPSFMKSDAWADKELNTSLGSWAELRHDTILYAKQSYTLAGAAMPPQEKPKGYVEPNPELYGRLASLAKMTYDGLYSRGLLEDTLATKLENLRQLLLKLKDMSEKELAGKALSDDEYDYIKYFGGQLENITHLPAGSGQHHRERH